jgi:BirA family transcriptional regulator, biotin operon repressor / biotin---[acetyl-CoA-carboxylase] ligase
MIKSKSARGLFGGPMTDQLTDAYRVADLETLLGERPFRYFEQTTSTNDVARDWQMIQDDLTSGAVVIADEQTSGRGRIGRRWHSPAGQAIAMSVILRPKLNADDLHRITMLAGVAVAETLQKILPAEKNLVLKWPNDVLIEDHKVSGILAEAVWLGNDLDAVIVGIGVNVRVNFQDSPYAEIATSIEEHTPSFVPRLQLIHHILQRLDYWETNIHSPHLLETWRSWLGTIGEEIGYETTHGKIIGVARDVDSSGALLVEDGVGKTHRITVGDILRRVNNT